MALRIFLRNPWYDPEGYHRRVEDNPHTVNLDLAVLPSTAEVEGPNGKREKVWELRGEPDPAKRAQLAADEAKAREALPLARALQNPQGVVKDTEALEKELEATKKQLAEAQKKLEVDAPKLPDKTPPIQQEAGDGTNAIPGSNPQTHGTQASAEGERAPGSSEEVPAQPKIPAAKK